MNDKTIKFLGALLVTTALAGTMSLSSEVSAAQKSVSMNSGENQEAGLFASDGYRANKEIQTSLDKIWKLEGNAHHKLNSSSSAKVYGVSVKLPSLITEIEDAMVGKGSNFAKDLSSELSKKQLSETRDYLREVTKDKLHDVGIEKAGFYTSHKTLETAGQVETGSAKNPLTPPKRGQYHRVTKSTKPEIRQAKVEYNLRNYKDEKGIVQQGNNNFFVDLGKRESSLNPWAGQPRNDKMGCTLMFQMCSRERKEFGGSKKGDWHGQREAAEDLARDNLKVLDRLVPNLDHKVINFSNGMTLRPSDSALSGTTWLAGTPNTASVLNGKSKFKTDSLETHPYAYMLAFNNYDVDFGERNKKKESHTPSHEKKSEKPSPVVNNKQHKQHTHEGIIMRTLRVIRNAIRPLIFDDDETTDKKQNKKVSFNTDTTDNNSLIDRVLETQNQKNLFAIVINDPKKVESKSDQPVPVKGKTKWQEMFPKVSEDKSNVEKIVLSTEGAISQNGRIT